MRAYLLRARDTLKKGRVPLQTPAPSGSGLHTRSTHNKPNWPITFKRSSSSKRNSARQRRSVHAFAKREYRRIQYAPSCGEATAHRLREDTTPAGHPPTEAPHREAAPACGTAFPHPPGRGRSSMRPPKLRPAGRHSTSQLRRANMGVLLEPYKATLS